MEPAGRRAGTELGVMAASFRMDRSAFFSDRLTVALFVSALGVTQLRPAGQDTDAWLAMVANCWPVGMCARTRIFRLLTLLGDVREMPASSVQVTVCRAT